MSEARGDGDDCLAKKRRSPCCCIHRNWHLSVDRGGIAKLAIEVIPPRDGCAVRTQRQAMITARCDTNHCLTKERRYS